MGIETHVGWTDATWNIAIGCDKISEGCLFCYMMRDGAWRGQNRNGNVVQTKTVFDAPLKWKVRTANLLKKQAADTLTENEAHELVKLLKIKLVFTSSLTDFFHEKIDSYRSEAWDIIRQCPEYTFQILTKRIERVPDLLPADWGAGWANVILMATAENQERWDERIPILQSIPAQRRGVSVEPMLSAVNVSKGLKYDVNGAPLIHWIVAGGESGNDKGEWRYRKSRIEWYSNVVNDCKKLGIPVFMKQTGTWISKELKMSDRSGSVLSEFPAELQVREFPAELTNP